MDIPLELTSRPQWVVWRWEERDGEPTKPPYNPRDGRLASSTDPTTWATYEEVLAACKSGAWAGVGYVFTPDDPFAGVDLDNCIDRLTSEIKPWAGAIIDHLASYTEISPSLGGVKIILKGTLPRDGRRRYGRQIEMYDSGRYFTITGQHLEGTPTTIQDRGDKVLALYEWLFSPNGPSPHRGGSGRPQNLLTDIEIINKALAARNGAAFAKLWGGDWSDYPSQSEGDLALCNHLAFWTGGDAEGMDRLFRQSGLYRDKWDERHYGDGRTYAQATIETTLENPRRFYNSGHRTRQIGSDDGGQPSSERAGFFPRTDAGNGELFAFLNGERVRYDHRRHRWLLWAEYWWRPDADAHVRRLAKEAARHRYQAAASIDDLKDREAEARWSISSESRMRLEAMLALATSERPIADSGEGWDSDPWLLGVANGVIDLRTGMLRKGRPEDRITMHAPIAYDPDAPHPCWSSFLDRVLDGNDNLVHFLQRAVGYSLTGDVSEQVLLFLYGTGANGKSTFLTALLDLLGDYGRQAAPGLLLAKRGERHPTEYADLEGSRFVASVEVDEGKRLAEGLVKWLTGGDRMKARKMRQDFFEFIPTYKLWLAANHKPTIVGTDLAIWRRIRLIPFTVVIPVEEQDPHLPEKLRAELPGILAWAVRGCLQWQRDGLGVPEEVEAATRAYRSEQDVLKNFLDDCCIIHPDGEVATSALYLAYGEWCKEAGEKPLTKRAFGQALAERDFEPGRTYRDGRVWRGVALRMTQGDQLTVSEAMTGEKNVVQSMTHSTGDLDTT